MASEITRADRWRLGATYCGKMTYMVVDEMNRCCLASVLPRARTRPRSRHGFHNNAKQ
jgi:hypothetical protein